MSCFIVWTNPYALGYLIDTLTPNDRLLVVDDVFDSGRSIASFREELATCCRFNMPKTVKVATVYYERSRNKANLKPDFYIPETEE